MVPPRPPSVTPPPLPLGGVPKDAESVPKPSVSTAISRGRSGVVDVQGLLTRQPSVHPPIRARTPSGQVEQLQHQKEAALMSALMTPFATSTAVQTSASQLSHSQNLSALPPITAGTAGTAGIAGSAGIAGTAGTAAFPVLSTAATGLAAQQESHTRQPLSLQRHASRAAAAVGHLPANAPASGASPLRQGPTDSAASSHFRVSSAEDSAVVNQAGMQPFAGSTGQADAAGNDSSKAVSTFTDLASQQSSNSTKPRSHGPSPTLQLSLLDAAPVNVVGGKGQQATPSAAITAQQSENVGQAADRPSMTDLAPRVVHDGSTCAAKCAEQTLHSFPPGQPAVLDSMHSRHSSTLSSSTSRSKSVTFGGAQSLGLQHGSQKNVSRSTLGEEQYESLCSPQGLTQQHGAFGKGGSLPMSSSSSNGSAVVRLSSSLSAAVTETMQDRMLAGGMMHSQTDNTHADRCSWLRNTLPDRCPWPCSSVRAGNPPQDRCTWPRSSLKNTANEQPGSLQASRVSDAAAGSTGNARDGRRSMPSQLARHQSSLNQVSRRPDFAAAMNAVRNSWRAEQLGQLASPESSLANNTFDDCTAAENAQSSLDAVWASIDIKNSQSALRVASDNECETL